MSAGAVDSQYLVHLVKKMRGRDADNWFHGFTRPFDDTANPYLPSTDQDAFLRALANRRDHLMLLHEIGAGSPATRQAIKSINQLRKDVFALRGREATEAQRLALHAIAGIGFSRARDVAVGTGNFVALRILHDRRSHPALLSNLESRAPSQVLREVELLVPQPRRTHFLDRFLGPPTPTITNIDATAISTLLKHLDPAISIGEHVRGSAISAEGLEQARHAVNGLRIRLGSDAAAIDRSWREARALAQEAHALAQVAPNVSSSALLPRISQAVAQLVERFPGLRHRISLEGIHVLPEHDLVGMELRVAAVERSLGTYDAALAARARELARQLGEQRVHTAMVRSVLDHVDHDISHSLVGDAAPLLRDPVAYVTAHARRDAGLVSRFEQLRRDAARPIRDARDLLMRVADNTSAPVVLRGEAEFASTRLTSLASELASRELATAKQASASNAIVDATGTLTRLWNTRPTFVADHARSAAAAADATAINAAGRGEIRKLVSSTQQLEHAIPQARDELTTMLRLLASDAIEGKVRSLDEILQQVTDAKPMLDRYDDASRTLQNAYPELTPVARSAT